MLEYQSSDTTMTLREGLEEYYGSSQGLYDGRGSSERANRFFRCHDVAHVVFGCSTNLDEEGLVKLWSFFGTTAGLSLLRDYRSPESKEIYETIAWKDVPGTAARALRTTPLVLFRCLRLRKRWPWDAYEPYLDTSLARIRDEFGIELVSRTSRGSAFERST